MEVKTFDSATAAMLLLEGKEVEHKLPNGQWEKVSKLLNVYGKYRLAPKYD